MRQEFNCKFDWTLLYWRLCSDLKKVFWRLYVIFPLPLPVLGQICWWLLSSGGAESNSSFKNSIKSELKAKKTKLIWPKNFNSSGSKSENFSSPNLCFKEKPRHNSSKESNFYLILITNLIFSGLLELNQILKWSQNLRFFILLFQI